MISTEDPEFRDLNRRIDVLLQRFLVPWPAPFTIYHEVLFQNLVDLQIDSLLSASRKDGTDVDDLRRQVDEWELVKDGCARVVRMAQHEDPKDPFVSVWEVVVRKNISKLPGGYDVSWRVRAAAAWAQDQEGNTNSGSAWAIGIHRMLEKLATALYHVPVHPAIVAQMARKNGGIKKLRLLCDDMGLM